MQEILVSYKLLVLFDRRARKAYRNTLRTALQGTLFDNELDVACLGHMQSWYQEYTRPPPSFRVREAFYAPSDFPIFLPRLTNLHKFMDSIQPNRISALWTD